MKEMTDPFMTNYSVAFTVEEYTVPEGSPTDSLITNMPSRAYVVYDGSDKHPFTTRSEKIHITCAVLILICTIITLILIMRMSKKKDFGLKHK